MLRPVRQQAVVDVGVIDLDMFDVGSDFPEPKSSVDALALQHLKDVTEAP